MAYDVKSKSPMTTKGSPKPFRNKPRDPYFKDQKPKPKPSTIKKKKSLKYISIGELPTKRMYRLSIILGSTILCDTFTVDEPFATSVVSTRDKINESYRDLTKLLDKNISGGMLPRIFDKIWDTTHKGIMEGENNDIIHNIVRDLFTPGPNTKDVEFPSIISYSITPGKPSKDVTKRVVIRLNYVTNPNFEPKKKVKVKQEQHDLEVVKKDDVIEYKSKQVKSSTKAPYKIVNKKPATKTTSKAKKK